MAKSFDIMRRPWIKCCLFDGSIQKLSLYDVITKAPTIKELIPPGKQKLTEYILYSFITDFVEDVYQPQQPLEEAVMDYLEQGSFDKLTLDKYIESFEAEGFSFDLFNPGKPFMQTPLSEMPKDAIKKNLSTVGFETPSSSEPLFFSRIGMPTFEDIVSKFGIDPDEVPLGYDLKDIAGFKEKSYEFGTFEIDEIMTKMLFLFGYRQSYNGVFPAISTAKSTGGHLPVYVLNKGRNLFETICMSMGARYSDVPPMWRRKFNTSLSNLLAQDADALALSYTPTCYFRLINTESYSISNNIVKKEEKAAFKGLQEVAYQRWAMQYPRIIKQKLVEKDGKEVIKATIFKERNPKYTSLETLKLDLACGKNDCAILKDLKETKEETGVSSETEFYCVRHRSGSDKNCTEESVSYTWETNKKYPNAYAQRNIKEAIHHIEVLANACANAMTKMDEDAVGTTEHRDVFSSNASIYTDDCITNAVWLLENDLYDSLFEESAELPEVIEYEFQKIFANALRSYPIKKHDIISKTKAIDEFWKVVYGKTKKKGKSNERRSQGKA